MGLVGSWRTSERAFIKIGTAILEIVQSKIIAISEARLNYTTFPESNYNPGTQAGPKQKITLLCIAIMAKYFPQRCLLYVKLGVPFYMHQFKIL